MTEASTLSPAVDRLWARRAELSPADADAAVVAAVDQLDRGRARGCREESRGGTFGLPRVLVPGGRHDKAALDDVLREHGVNT